MTTPLFRARLALKAAGFSDRTPVERVPGSLNEVWFAERFVVRITPRQHSRRLEHEVEVAALLPPDVPYPPVVAYGRAPFGEWLVLRRVPGEPLARVWGGLDDTERASAIRQLGVVLARVHAVPASRGPWGPVTSAMAARQHELPHQLPPARLLELLLQARGLPFVEPGVVDEAVRLVRRGADALDDTGRWGLVHGDLHFENVLWRDGRITALLDFEHARAGPPDLDLEVMLRFCEDPGLHVAPDYAATLSRRSFRGVVAWLQQAYPGLLAHPRLEDRIALYSLAYDVPLLLRDPPRRDPTSLPPHHPYLRIRRVVAGHSPLMALTF